MAVRTAPVSPTRVIDGDTFVGTLHLWDHPKVDLVDTRFRLDGINCPEMRDKITGARVPEGLAAQDFVARWLVDENGDWLPVTVASRGLDNYGRTLAVVTAKGREISLNGALLAAGHAEVMKMLVAEPA
jgi:endonuclease YncB( thermonuclease family)